MICGEGEVKMFMRQLLKRTTSVMGPRVFKYTHAIMREPPKSFAEHAVKTNPSQQISFPCVKQQWTKYKDILEQIGLKVIILPADETYSDCVFVEDVAVVIGQKACLTQPGHPTRRNEGEAIRECLHNLGFEVQELDDPSATLDGGDVLFTGQEIFVGESGRTNKAGANSLQRVFSDLPVTTVPVVKSLHLKCIATMAQEGVLLVGGCADAQTVLKVVQEKARGQYHIIQLEDEKSANVLSVNGQVVVKSEKELGQDFLKLTSSLTVPWTDIEFDELYKADGCLTCCSIFIQAPQDSS